MSSARSRSGNGEYTQGDVDYLVRELVRLNINKVTKEYPDPPTTPRAAHTKCIGLLKGTFKINDNVPAELHHGLFAQSNAEFPCYVRFSNALQDNDSAKDFRGIAIKLVDPNEQTLQDFILVNKQDFPLGTPWMFLSLFYWSAISPVLMLAVFACKLQLRALLNAAGTVSFSLADQTFYSTTPFSLGNEAPVSIAQEEDVVAVKYMLRPSRDNGHGAVLAQVHGENYLRNELEAHLGTKHTLSWAFCIQRRTNKKQMPLNDASVVWTSEFVQVATLTIEDQDFTTSQRFELAEALSFNLKNHQPMHQPLGNMNRVRMEVYDQMSKFRHARAGRRDPNASPKPTGEDVSSTKPLDSQTVKLT